MPNQPYLQWECYWQNEPHLRCHSPTPDLTLPAHSKSSKATQDIQSHSNPTPAFSFAWLPKQFIWNSAPTSPLRSSYQPSEGSAPEEAYRHTYILTTARTLSVQEMKWSRSRNYSNPSPRKKPFPTSPHHRKFHTTKSCSLWRTLGSSSQSYEDITADNSEVPHPGIPTAGKSADRSRSHAQLKTHSPNYSTDVDAPLTLTPDHFLIGRPLISPPVQEADDLNQHSMFKREQRAPTLTRTMESLEFPVHPVTERQVQMAPRHPQSTDWWYTDW